jgi:hypothetical protein
MRADVEADAQLSTWTRRQNLAIGQKKVQWNDEEEGTLHANLEEAWGVKLSPEVREGDEAVVAQDSSRARD